MSNPNSARLKAARAKKHILDLGHASISFGETDPYILDHKDNYQARERTYYIKSIEPVDPIFSVLAGDALQNLRSALDHLIHAAIFKETKQWPTSTLIAFPIGKSSAQYASAEFRRRIEGLGQLGIEILDSLHPYKGGNESLWHLQSLNNIDKHRLIIPAFTNLVSHSITPSIRRKVVEGYFGSNPNASVMPDLYRVNIAPTQPVDFPLKEGSVLLTISADDLEDEMRFTFSVAFNEPGLVEGELIEDVLLNLLGTVEGIIGQFERAGLV